MERGVGNLDRGRNFRGAQRRAKEVVCCVNRYVGQATLSKGGSGAEGHGGRDGETEEAFVCGGLQFVRGILEGVVVRGLLAQHGG